MHNPEDPQENERIFTLEEANSLIPQLEQLWGRIKEGKIILVETREEIQKASAHAHLGGGSLVGPQYIQALKDINESLHTIHELGVIVKDVDIGLCDFPYLLDGKIVYLCWKIGEEKISWWHETTSGYAGRQVLPENSSS
ncbi:MAG: DUF2203 domain-containing protein [Nitrospirales bacterium]|nr:DUF2203 domain-containing protein [Nitrospira sp.]MDR4500293.1 DUF2203 domain-containing protein [Nitrospirales bacterium]